MGFHIWNGKQWRSVSKTGAALRRARGHRVVESKDKPAEAPTAKRRTEPAAPRPAKPRVAVVASPVPIAASKAEATYGATWADLEKLTSPADKK